MKPARKQFLSLDFVRFFAACAVMFYHFAQHSWHAPETTYGIRAAIGAPVRFETLGPWTQWGFLGVEVFFLISGFVIALSAEGRTAFAFFRSRVVRLVPALWTFVLLAFAVTLAYADAPLTETLNLLARSLALYPLGPWLDGVYWTLTVEIAFYAIVFFLILLGRFDGLERIAQWWSVLCLALLLATIGARAADGEIAALNVIAGFVESYASRPALISTGPYFALGVMLYGVVRRGGTPARAGFAAIAAAGGLISAHLTTGAWDGVAVWATATAITAGLILWEARPGERAAPPAGLARLARQLGLAAYPIYLAHNISGAWLMGRLVELGAPAHAALFGAAAACVAVSLAFAALLEPPLQRGLRAGIDAVWERSGFGTRSAPTSAS